MPSKPESSPDPHSIPLLSPDDEEQQHQRSPSNQLYTPSPPAKRPLLNRYSWIVAAILLLIFIGLLAVPTPGTRQEDDDWEETAPVPDSSGICKQFKFADLPDDELSKTLDRTLKSEEYLRGSADRLSGAVRIATESFDDMGPVGADPRWDIFQEFHDYLEKTYPLMYPPLPPFSPVPSFLVAWFVDNRYSRLKVEIVNTWGLVFTWNGTDRDLKPSGQLVGMEVNSSAIRGSSGCCSCSQGYGEYMDVSTKLRAQRRRKDMGKRYLPTQPPRTTPYS